MQSDLLHGGALDHMRREFPESKEPWIDLSTGINPWPWPVQAPDLTSLNHLPSSTTFRECKAVMAKAFAAPLEAVLPAPGSEILIRLLPTLINAKTVAILDPSYGDHCRAWQLAGANVLQTADPLAEADSADVVVVCNPNNPDGRTFSIADLERARKCLAKRGCWLIVDEAYVDISPELSMAENVGQGGLIVFRSVGKVYGLAGLRLGALIAPEPIVNAMSELLGVWSLPEATLSIGADLYRDAEWLEHTKVRLSAARRRLDQILVSAGLQVLGGTDLYRFIKTDNAHALWEHLARQAIYVRRFEALGHNLRFGLPATKAQESRLASALMRIDIAEPY